ncbi:MAG TPA: hypothetical protein PL033_19260 [Candidatus Brocadiia bacterium]|nr:hypothetical protein [Candidatus Brocadiia bacterium]
MVIVAALPAAAWAANPEIEFARGLRNLKFQDLCIEQCRRILLRKDLPEDVILQAHYELSSTFVILGDAAGKKGDGKKQREHYAQAIEHFDAYLKQPVTDGNKDAICDARYERAELAQKLTRMYARFVQWTSDTEEAKRFRMSALQYSDVCVNEFSKIRLLYEDEYKWLEKNAKTGEQKERFFFVRERRGLAWVNEGWAYFDAAMLIDKTAEKSKRDSLLDESRKAMFALTNDELLAHYVVALSAYQCIGLVMLENGDYAAAHQMFDNVTRVNTTDATVRIKMTAMIGDIRTYMAQQRYESAMTVADKLIGDFAGAEADVFDEAMLARGRAGVGFAEQLKTRADTAAGQGNKEEQAKLMRDAQQLLQDSLDAANAVAEREGPWRREAELLRSEWTGKTAALLGKELKITPTAEVLFADAGRFQKEGKYEEAIQTYRLAILRASPVRHKNRILPESWYNLALCHYDTWKQKKGQAAFFYYEASLCFEQCAREFAGPEGGYGAHSAYNNVQFQGKLFDYVKKKCGIEPGMPVPDEVRYEAKRYVRALDLLVRDYPDNPHRDWAIFQSAEINRTIGGFLDAAAVYANVPQGNENYAQAAFMTGNCYWLEASRLIKAGSIGEEAKSRRDKAVEQLTGFMEWWKDAEGRSLKEQREQIIPWVARARAVLGEIYTAEQWNEPETALAVLDGFEETFKPGDALRNSALFSRIQANRYLGRLADAEKSVDRILADGANPELARVSARLLGKAYFMEMKSLQDKGDTHKANEAGKKGAQYMDKALALNPNQTIDEYMILGRELQDIRVYAEAEAMYKKGIERFKSDAASDQKVWTLRARIAQVQTAQERYAEAAGTLQEVVRKFPDVIDYKQSLATCYEKLAQHDKAAQYWLLVSKSAKDPSPEYYEARYHIALNYALAGNLDKSYSIVAFLAETHAEMGGPEMIRRFTKLVEEKMPTRLNEFRETVGAAAWQPASENKG